MSRLKPRTMPNLFDLINQSPTRELKDGQSEEVSPIEKVELAVEKVPELAVPELAVPELADAAFCRQCGEWLSSDYISLGIKFRCPECDYSLFSINRVNSRKKWEENKMKETKIS